MVIAATEPWTPVDAHGFAVRLVGVIEPLAVVPKNEKSVLIGVDEKRVVELAALDLPHDATFAVSPSGHVACAHRHVERKTRSSVLVVRHPNGATQTRDTNEDLHIVSVAIANGRVFAAAGQKGLFSWPLDDLSAPPIEYETTVAEVRMPSSFDSDPVSVNGLVVDGDRLVVMEGDRWQYRFAIFDTRRPTATEAVRRVVVDKEWHAKPRLGGAFILTETRRRSSGEFRDTIHLHDRVSLSEVGQTSRAFPDSWESDTRRSPEWAGAAVLDDVLAIGEASGSVLVIPCDALVSGTGAAASDIGAPRRPSPFGTGVMERIIPIPYRRAGVVVLQQRGTRSVHVWEP